MMLFQKYVLKMPINQESDLDILSVLESVILDMIQMERRGEVVDRSLIRACVYVLEHLYESWNECENSKLYLTSLEPKFLETSRMFYDQEGRSLVANADASTFCIHATRRIREEEERCQQTLSQATESKIKAIVDKELIARHIQDIINMAGTGVKHMLDNERIEDLVNVYDLSARVDPRKLALKDAVKKRVVELGSDINKNALTAIPTPTANTADKQDSGKAVSERPVNQQTAAAITWVEEVLQLKAKYDRLWEQAFRKDPVMEKALEVSFQDFINENPRSSEHLSLFLDENLKKGVKGKTDAEVDFLLDKGIVLLQYISDKDLFETYYKKHLSKRLLMKKSASMDIERQMISKMKIKVGNTFTQRLESMFKDMNVSDDLNAQYKEYVSKLGDPDTRRIDIEASILTTTIWPFENLFRSNDGTARLACVFPPVVENVRKRFEKFYLDKHSGRALSWQANMGTVDIRTTFRRANGKVQRHDLNVSTYAMIILLLFQDLPSSQCLTFEEIEAQTNIPAYELIRNLQSLALALKTRVLRKEPMSKDVRPTDKFYFNEEFTSNFVKVKIGVVSGSSSKVESGEERKDTQKRTDEERGVAIEAAIVRIMK
jgi:cullin 3